MKLRPFPTGVALAALACNACDSPPDDRPSALEAVVRDSADTRIIENPRPPSGSRLDWRVGVEPAVSIGAVEGEGPYMLHRVANAFILPGGRIVVVNSGSHELRVFDELGDHLATWGRRGEGPGEFTALVDAHRWRGDSVIAMYSQRNDIAVLDSEGGFARTFALQRDDEFFVVEAVSPGGAVLSSDRVGRGGLPEGLNRLEHHYRVWDGEGEIRSSLGSFPGSEWFSAWSGTIGWSVQITFAHQISTFAWGDLMAVAPNDGYEIRAFDHDGTLRRIVRRDHDPVVPTSAHEEADFERRIAGLPEEERAERRRRMRERDEEVPLPETFPAFETALADATAHLWVREYDIPGEETPDPAWSVFDPDGRILGFVETPAGLSVFEIGEDYILGLATDDLGVEFVQVWSLERSGR